MESRNCSLPAPEFYRNLMHFSHIVTFPVYIATLVALFLEKSKAFWTYKWYLIVHVLINFASESYVSFFMLPMTYLPNPIFRTTGWLSQLGVSGLVQFYCLAQFSAMTVCSIAEMFYYRFKVCIIHYRSHRLSKVFKYQVYLFRFLILLHPIVNIVTFNPSVEAQDETRRKLWLSQQTLPPEITCYSVIIAVLDNSVFWICITIYCMQIVLSITTSTGPLIYITKFISNGMVLSAATKRLQKMLLISLFIQGTIHGILIITPTIFQIYAIFFELTRDDLAYTLLMCFAYHGFASTCAMVTFTKPIRERLFCCCKRQPSSGTSMVAPSSTQDRHSNAPV